MSYSFSTLCSKSSSLTVESMADIGVYVKDDEYTCYRNISEYTGVRTSTYNFKEKGFDNLISSVQKYSQLYKIPIITINANSAEVEKAFHSVSSAKVTVVPETEIESDGYTLKEIAKAYAYYPEEVTSETTVKKSSKVSADGKKLQQLQSEINKATKKKKAIEKALESAFEGDVSTKTLKEIEKYVPEKEVSGKAELGEEMQKTLGDFYSSKLCSILIKIGRILH